MMYLWPSGNDMSWAHQNFGIMARPSDYAPFQGIKDGRWWAYDNMAFTQGFSPERWQSLLTELKPYRSRCLFVVAPDKVADAIATLTLYRYWGWRIKAQGWPVAFVAQDGQENLPFPPEFDCLFIGGSTDWKMSSAADYCIRYAKDLGKRVHVGRVNSQARFRHFQVIGVDSADGTFPCFEPNTAKRRLGRVVAQQLLFTLTK